MAILLADFFNLPVAVLHADYQHSSADLTNKVYTNVDPVLRHAVDLIPSSDWLKWVACGEPS